VETTALNVSTDRYITMGCGSLFQSDIVRGKTILDCFGLKWRDIERLKCMCRDGREGSLCCWFFLFFLFFFKVNATFSFAFLCILTSQASLRMSSRVLEKKSGSWQRENINFLIDYHFDPNPYYILRLKRRVYVTCIRKNNGSVITFEKYMWTLLYRSTNTWMRYEGIEKSKVAGIIQGENSKCKLEMTCMCYTYYI
jgi:hypothetical protein